MVKTQGFSLGYDTDVMLRCNTEFCLGTIQVYICIRYRVEG